MTLRIGRWLPALIAVAAASSACSLLVPVTGLSGGAEEDGGGDEPPSAGGASPLPGVVLGDASPGSGGTGGFDAAEPSGVDASAPDGAVTTGAVDAGEHDAGKDTGTVDAAPPTCVGGKGRVFVTSTLYTPAFGGVVGADADCLIRATAKGLGGNWKAWLSDSKTDAPTHVHSSATSYVLLDGTVVASSFNALVSGSLSHAIDKTEMNAVPPDGNTEVWSGIDVSGAMGNGGFCNDASGDDWASTDPGASTPLVGHLDANDATWSAAYLQVCNRTNVRLYCFEVCP